MAEHFFSVAELYMFAATWLVSHLIFSFWCFRKFKTLTYLIHWPWNCENSATNFHAATWLFQKTKKKLDNLYFLFKICFLQKIIFSVQRTIENLKFLEKTKTNLFLIFLWGLLFIPNFSIFSDGKMIEYLLFIIINVITLITCSYCPIKHIHSSTPTTGELWKFP